MTHSKILDDIFYDSTKKVIEGGGEPMNQCIWFDTSKDGLIMEVMMVDEDTYVRHVINTIDGGNCSYLLFTLDMKARPGQGLEFDDFVVIGEWDSDRSESEQWRWGVIDYKLPEGDEPAIVRPINWQQVYWSKKMPVHFKAIMRRAVPFRVKVRKNVGIKDPVVLVDIQDKFVNGEKP